MARLPQPGSDNGTWGDILNDYLSQALKSDGTIKDNSITNAAIAPNAITTAEIQDGSIQEAKLSSAVQTKLNASTGTILSTDITDSTSIGRSLLTATDATAAKIALSLAKADIGLGNVDNTSDTTKNSALATLTNKTISGSSNTFSNIPESAVTNLIADLTAKLNKLASVNSQTTSYALVLGDTDVIIEVTNSSATNITVPPNSSVAFPVGTIIEIMQGDIGQVTLVAGGGVTLQTPASLKTRTQYSSVSIRKRTADTWVVAGDLE